MEFDLKEVIEHHILDHVWTRLSLGPVSLPWSMHTLMLGLGAVLAVLVLTFAARGESRLARMLRLAIEAVVLFIRDDIVMPNLGGEGLPYLGYFCTLFFFILVLNGMGLVPYGATATGNIAVTATLALTTFCLIHLAGVREHGLGYFKGIVPHGVPMWLFPLMLPIEFIGFVTKSFALCVRLFANMIAGHIVITVLLGLILIFGQSMGAKTMILTAPVSVGLALGVSLLEIFVAFLQAYIFTFLTAIFVGGAIHQH